MTTADKKQKQTHFKKPNRLSLVLTTMVVCALGVSLIKGSSLQFTSKASAGTSPLDRVSTAGVQVNLSARGQEMLSRINRDYPVSNTTLLATQGSTSFYKLLGVGRSCYAVGPSGDAGTLSAARCEAAFPSTSLPVLSLPIVESSQAVQRLHYYTLSGIVADGVQAIAAVNDSGGVLARTTVQDNSFELTNIPGVATGFVALGTDGQAIYQESLPGSN